MKDTYKEETLKISYNFYLVLRYLLISIIEVPFTQLLYCADTFLSCFNTKYNLQDYRFLIIEVFDFLGYYILCQVGIHGLN